LHGTSSAGLGWKLPGLTATGKRLVFKPELDGRNPDGGVKSGEGII
jgi:hypothetical protein